MPRPVKFRGTVEGEIMEIKMVDIDCPLVGSEVIVNADGRVWVNVDGVCVLRINRGGIVTVEDARTGYRHEAADLTDTGL